MIRTLAEVHARFTDVQRRQYDLFGFGSEVLGDFLPVGANKPLTEEVVRHEAVNYLYFAFTKAINHRGISAARSVTKMREYAWILGLDDAVAFADEEVNFPYYGVPVLKHMAHAFGVPLPDAITEWPDGKPCSPTCSNGCLS